MFFSDFIDQCVYICLSDIIGAVRRLKMLSQLIALQILKIMFFLAIKFMLSVAWKAFMICKSGNIHISVLNWD